MMCSQIFQTIPEHSTSSKMLWNALENQASINISIEGETPNARPS